MDKQTALFQEIRDLIGKGKVEKAIHLLEKANLPGLGNKVTILKSRYKEVTQNQILGVITEADARLELNRIKHGILKITENDYTLQTGISERLSKKKWPLILAIFVIIALAFGGYKGYYFLQENKATKLYQDKLERGSAEFEKNPPDYLSAKGYFEAAIEAADGFDINTEEATSRINECDSLKKINEANNSKQGTFIFDGQTYNWIKMKDGKEWMMQNLKYPQSGSWCFNKKESNCKKYGRLYTWEDAKLACKSLGKVIPGWRLPKKQDFADLAIDYGGYVEREFIDDEKIVGDSKEAYEELNDLLQLDKQLGGYRKSGKQGLQFSDLGTRSWYWSSDEFNEQRAYSFGIYAHKSPGELVFYPSYKDQGFSCLCVKDE